MNDPELVAFLRWALPRVGLRWQGYRKVRARVRKKLNERLGELGLPEVRQREVLRGIVARLVAGVTWSSEFTSRSPGASPTSSGAATDRVSGESARRAEAPRDGPMAAPVGRRGRSLVLA
jgi:hypothetical protein